MNNPFKTIGIALILSVVGLLSIVELPKLLSQFNQSEWLIAMAFAVLLSLSLLISILNNAQKVQQSISVKSNH
jgi:CHASE1-domain containing sensor protein